MGRRTRKQKEKQTQKRVSLNLPQGSVNREFEFSFTGSNTVAFGKYENKKVDKSFYFYQTATTLKDVIKTVMIAAIIFSLEIMIYFAWLKETGSLYQIYKLILQEIH